MGPNRRRPTSLKPQEFERRVWPAVCQKAEPPDSGCWIDPTQQVWTKSSETSWVGESWMLLPLPKNMGPYRFARPMTDARVARRTVQLHRAKVLLGERLDPPEGLRSPLLLRLRRRRS